MRLRKTNPGDLPQLKALWALGFGDTEQEIEAFFAISYPTATGFCAEEDSRLIAAAYALPQELAWGEKSCRSAYLYAVTTHPDFRKRGICAKLLAYAEKELKKRYFDCLTLVPATDALRAYYETLGFVSQNAAFFDEGGAPEAHGVCEVLTPAEYAGLRETVLYDLPHVRYGLSDLRYQASMSGFYRLELGSHFGCACAHPDGETLVVDEILPDCSVLPALLKQLPAKRCRVRTVGGSTPFAMCKWLSDARMPDVYLAFDFG